MATPTRTELPAPDPDEPGPEPSRGTGVLALLRNTWRGLTSMRTALVLLFLLALAALPGALLPQRSLNQRLVDDYLADHPQLGPVLDRLGLFDVFAAPWFAAIYLLLMVSLVGCVLPRTSRTPRRCAAPVATPRNLARLPHHAVGELDVGLDEATERVEARLRRLAPADRPDGAGRTVSAEKGYLREPGNLAFHISLIGVLLGFAAGKLYGYEGQVVVLSGGGQFCNTGILGYDSFHPGLRVDGTDLTPFCVRVDDFTADYLPNGQAESFRAASATRPPRTWRPAAPDGGPTSSPSTTRCGSTATASTCSDRATRRASPSPSRTAPSAPRRPSGARSAAGRAQAGRVVPDLLHQHLGDHVVAAQQCGADDVGDRRRREGGDGEAALGRGPVLGGARYRDAVAPERLTEETGVDERGVLEELAAGRVTVAVDHRARRSARLPTGTAGRSSPRRGARGRSGSRRRGGAR